MEVSPHLDKFANIRVVGVGGAGGNVVNTMVESQTNGVEFIAVNTDAQDLAACKATVKIAMGHELTSGLGAGANPEVGQRAAEESLDQIRENLEGSDMVFVTAGMGGGTGTGAAPIVARIAKDLGALTIAVVTKPFNFEGAQRMKNAELGIKQLRESVDAIIIIPNQKLLDLADETMTIQEAFKVSDSILNQGVQGISDIIVRSGLVNVDFADVRTIMKDAGSALMGIGIGTGEGRAENAAKEAILSPLLDVSIDGATGILFNITGGPDMGMREMDIAAKIITEAADPNANVIFGATINESLSDTIKVTVIATGFKEEEENAYSSYSFVSQPSYQSTPVYSASASENESTVVKSSEPVTSDPKISSSPKVEEPKEDVAVPAPDEKDDTSGDNQFDIPAFLRRK
jgi:cell division protein FtsZ